MRRRRGARLTERARQSDDGAGGLACCDTMAAADGAPGVRRIAVGAGIGAIGVLWHPRINQIVCGLSNGSCMVRR